ncbi:TRAM domain-containing protein [Candidatus Micrarchaeota archaeon]|nr:TRAM domain-containing protein [Candidatus Micrarchaeota archaeon]
MDKNSENSTHPFDSIPKPVKEGDEVEVTITNESQRGDGVAKVDGFIVFVKDGKKGETIRIKITSVGRTHATAEKISS